MRRWVPGAAALLLLVTACGGAEAGDGAGTPSLEDYAALDPCPDQPEQEAAGPATLPPLAFDCLGGGALDLARAPGVPTLVNLWGSWCAPCRKELPLLQEFSTAAGDRVRVLGVVSKDGAPQADSLADDLGITFPAAFDGEGRLMGELGINALPFTYFLDAEGALVHTEIGEISSVEELRALVAEHLGVQV